MNWYIRTKTEFLKLTPFCSLLQVDGRGTAVFGMSTSQPGSLLLDIYLTTDRFVTVIKCLITITQNNHYNYQPIKLKQIKSLHLIIWQKLLPRLLHHWPCTLQMIHPFLRRHSFYLQAYKRHIKFILTFNYYNEMKPLHYKCNYCECVGPVVCRICVISAPQQDVCVHVIALIAVNVD